MQWLLSDESRVRGMCNRCQSVAFTGITPCKQWIMTMIVDHVRLLYTLSISANTFTLHHTRPLFCHSGQDNKRALATMKAMVHPHACIPRASPDFLRFSRDPTSRQCLFFGSSANSVPSLSHPPSCPVSGRWCLRDILAGDNKALKDSPSVWLLQRIPHPILG
jgi:hypothetical protein